MVSTGDGADIGRRVLVLANETLIGVALRREIARRAMGSDVAVLVVCPALTNRLRHWLSDVDEAVTKANERLASSLAALAELGIAAEGRVGDGDPLLALRDAVTAFHPTEIVISTHPRGRSNWLEHHLVEQARNDFLIPVSHVVVDLEREVQAGQEPSAPRRGDAEHITQSR